MQRIEIPESVDQVAVLDGYPGLVLRMPVNVTVRNAESIRTAVLAAWREKGNPQKVVVDLSETRHLDSSGVGLLLELSKKAGDEGVAMDLCGLRPGPRRILERAHILG